MIGSILFFMFLGAVLFAMLASIIVPDIEEFRQEKEEVEIMLAKKIIEQKAKEREENKIMDLIVEVKSKKEGEKLLQRQGYGWVGDFGTESWYFNPVLNTYTKIITIYSDKQKENE